MSKDHFLEVTGLKKYFEADHPSFFSREARNVHAVDGVDFNLRRSEAVSYTHLTLPTNDLV